jgi:predicted dehydrogenase
MTSVLALHSNTHLFMTHPHSQHRLTRREFVRRSTLAAALAAMSAPSFLRGQNLNGKVNIAAIGVGGRGASDTRDSASENIVAVCDVDQTAAARVRQQHPDAKFHTDYRRMLEEMDKSIDAVIIATPDHLHAVIASLAMNMGKHVYCEKPLTQTIYEAHYLRDLAAKKNVVTQMGNQGSIEEGLRRAVEVVHAGIIGSVRQVHVWSNRPIWPQGIARPEGEDPLPTGLDWDLWIGPAPMRPFKERVYHPFNWRGWLDFGTGALGDMACHTANLPFRALKLGYATEVEAETPEGMNKETFPLASRIRFEFPAREGLPATTFWWYDGGKRSSNARGRTGHDGSNKPPREVTADVEAMQGQVPRSGCLLIGDKGKLFSPDDYGTRFFLKLDGMEGFVAARQGAADHEAIAQIPQTIPRSTTGRGGGGHNQEWIKAIKENKPELCYSRFSIAAYLTEIILLGCVAVRVGRKLEWDGANMTARNAPEAAPFVKREMRSGWKLA